MHLVQLLTTRHPEIKITYKDKGTDKESPRAFVDHPNVEALFPRKFHVLEVRAAFERQNRIGPAVLPHQALQTKAFGLVSSQVGGLLWNDWQRRNWR
jgi:hypothetical protein